MICEYCGQSVDKDELFSYAALDIDDTEEAAKLIAAGPEAIADFFEGPVGVRGWTRLHLTCPEPLSGLR